MTAVIKGRQETEWKEKRKAGETGAEFLFTASLNAPSRVIKIFVPKIFISSLDCAFSRRSKARAGHPRRSENKSFRGCPRFHYTAATVPAANPRTARDGGAGPAGTPPRTARDGGATRPAVAEGPTREHKEHGEHRANTCENFFRNFGEKA